jgi:hypothetical protein
VTTVFKKSVHRFTRGISESHWSRGHFAAFRNARSATATGFTLQQADTLGAITTWTKVSQTPSQTADEFVVAVPFAKAKQFFRLMHP